MRRSFTRSGQAAATAVLAAAALTVVSSPAFAGPARTAATPGATAVPNGGFHNELLKKRLGGENESAVEAPNLSALCRSFIGKPNPYRDPTPNVDQIVGDTVVTAGTQTGCSAAQNETTIAVNPNNPRNLVAGTNDYRVFNTRESRNDGSGWAYTTLDGGRTWANIQLPHLTFQTGASGPLAYMDSAGDPAIAIGPKNTVYYANLVFSREAHPGGQQEASGIAVSVSHNGGLSWDEPVIVQLDGVTPQGTYTPTYLFNDKEWIAADPVSGTVYVSWTRFTYDPATGAYLESPIVVSKSADFGRKWSKPTQVSPKSAGFTGGITSFDQGSSPQVGRDGTLYVAYEASVCATLACDTPADHDATVLATSRDGGRSFRNTDIGFNYDFPVNEDVGDATLTGENFRINSFPMTSYDRTSDKLWITWADDRNGKYDPATGASIKTNGDVFVVAYHHGDITETRTLGTASDEVFPAVAAHTNQVAVSYYTRAYDPKGIKLDYAYSTGRNDEIDHADIHRITTQGSDPSIQFVTTGQLSGKELQGAFIGDYTAIAMGSDLVVHPCWTDFRGRPGVTAPNQDAYTQAIPYRRG